jgi:hypothetical protein
MSAAAVHAVRVELGFGAEPLAGFGAVSWVDVTGDVVVGAGSTEAVRWSRGRRTVAGTLEPGAAWFELEAVDGRYDPLNAAGPYYGALRPGVPVRISVSELPDPVQWSVRWVGFVENWPMDLGTGAGVLERVAVSAHDVIGLLAAQGSPETAFAAEMRQLADDVEPPTQWWTAEPDGWLERLGGHRARHTAPLEEVDTPLIDGEEVTWGQSEPVGYGIAEGDESAMTAFGSLGLVSVWVRLDAERVTDTGTGWKLPTVIVWMQAEHLNPSSAGLEDRLYLAAHHDGVVIRATTTEGTVNWKTVDPIDLHDGQVHHLVADPGRPTGGSQPMLIIDGTLIELMELSPANYWGPTTYGWEHLQTRIGVGAGTSVWNGTPYQGVIDHLVLWETQGDNPAGKLALARRLAEAGRLAWVGQTLSERFEAVLAGLGVSAFVGDVDTSGIVTRQGYREAPPLELLEKLEQTEQGLVYVNREGLLCWRGRSWGWELAEELTADVHLTDVPELQADPTEPASGYWWPLLAGPSIGYDPLAITNAAQVTSEHGRMQTVEDAASIAEVGRRNPVHLSGLLHSSDYESRAIAEWIVRARGTARVRAERVGMHVDEQHEVAAGDSHNLWLTVCELEVGRRVHVRLAGRPAVPGLGLAAGAPRDLEGHTIGLEESFGWDGWRLWLALTDERVETSWFRWGSSAWGNAAGEGWAF